MLAGSGVEDQTLLKYGACVLTASSKPKVLIHGGTHPSPAPEKRPLSEEWLVIAWAEGSSQEYSKSQLGRVLLMLHATESNGPPLI